MTTETADKVPFPDVAITFLGTFFKASTLVDGGWRISFDVDAKQAPQAVKIAALKDSLLQFAIIPVASEKKTRGPF